MKGLEWEGLQAALEDNTGDGEQDGLRPEVWGWSQEGQLGCDNSIPLGLHSLTSSQLMYTQKHN